MPAKDRDDECAKNEEITVDSGVVKSVHPVQRRALRELKQRKR